MPEWLVILYRSVISLCFLFILTKLIGKRQLSQMTFFEYIAGITVGDLAANIAMDRDGTLFDGFLSLTIFALFPVAMGWLALKSKAVRNFFEGNARILIKNGKILEDNLKKERMTTDELLEQLRIKDVFRVADVEFAVMEPSGNVSILLKSENQPLTPKQLGITVSPASESQAVIMDGNIMDEPLATIGLNRDWLMTELAKTGVALENVFLGQVDDKGQLFVDLYDDKLKLPDPQVPKMTLFTMKKCQADLELFALSTTQKQGKELYEQQAKALQSVIDRVTPYLNS